MTEPGSQKGQASPSHQRLSRVAAMTSQLAPCRGPGLPMSSLHLPKRPFWEAQLACQSPPQSHHWPLSRSEPTPKFPPPASQGRRCGSSTAVPSTSPPQGLCPCTSVCRNALPQRASHSGLAPLPPSSVCSMPLPLRARPHPPHPPPPHSIPAHRSTQHYLASFCGFCIVCLPPARTAAPVGQRL